MVDRDETKSEQCEKGQASDKMDVNEVPTAKDHGFGDIVMLNVGGKRFSTSRQTLSWVPDSFFSSLMSGRIPSLRDETGAIFIDRDPDTFVPILHYLRTKTVNCRNIDLKTLKHEAEFYGILPLVKRLAVCEEAESGSCGNILFYSMLKPPVFEQPSPMDSLPLPKVIHGSKVEFSRQVIQLTGHGNYLAVAYNHCICVLGVRESRGWELVFTSPPLEKPPQRIALSSRIVGHGVLGGPLLAAVLGFEVKVWSCLPQSRALASFDMKIPVDGLFFTGIQLATISNTGRVAIWQSVQQHWQQQEVAPICSCDTGASFLLLGCSNGSIYYIDMEKFPVRMKDNDLLVTEMFEDPNKEPITALSVFCTPNHFASSGQNWMEVAYGTQSGRVVVVVRHPENIGQAPQVFQSYHVHTCAILRVVLGEKHLISVCGENHVRTWTVTRFRGRISTQPGSVPISSFKVLSLEGPHSLFYPINSIGPFGDLDEEQVFVQRIIPETDTIFVRLSSDGKRVCEIRSVDGSNITTYCVHECEAANRIGMRSRRFIFTGHTNGVIQIWDLTTALELSRQRPESNSGGPSQEELLEQLQKCDISASRVSSAVSSRAPSPSPSLMSIMFPGMKPGTCSVQAGTPTALLRSLGAPTANFFQPIQSNSTTGSNLSLSTANNSSSTLPVATPLALNIPEERSLGRNVSMSFADVGCQTDPWIPSNAGTLEKTEIESSNYGAANDRIADTSCQGGDVAASDRENSKQHKIPANAALAHQRSRSNEIDYSSARFAAGRANTVCFKSPPGSYGNMRAFRPVSACSTDATSSTFFSDSLPSVTGRSQTSSKDETSDSSRTLTPSPNASVEKNQYPVSRVSSEGRPASSSYWNREFATMSDYFTSDTEVTDC